ncbi:MAG: hypothetical protein VCC36_12280 [Gammaproteobacteria bacterium]
MTREIILAGRAASALLALSFAFLPMTHAQDTPRTADGRPDLSGYWMPSGSAVRIFDEAGSVSLDLLSRDGDIGNFEKDSAVLQRAHSNKPLYKPEYWDTVQDLDWNGLTVDPVFTCRPAGVPRMGPPGKIVQTPTEIIFMYEGSTNTGPAAYRIIPTDGRKHHALQVSDTSWLGYPVGHWEGDTLVIESVGFNDESWLGWTGYIHSWDMTVTERVRREGDTLHWEATVDDTMLLEPWTLNPVVRIVNPDPEAFFFSPTPCEERDAEHIVDPNVRG